MMLATAMPVYSAASSMICLHQFVALANRLAQIAAAQVLQVRAQHLGQHRFLAVFDRRLEGRRKMAVRLASASKQPRLPQLHFGPPTSITMWPISPAVPLWPEYNLPSRMMPPPMPVPRKMPTTCRGLDNEFRFKDSQYRRVAVVLHDTPARQVAFPGSFSAATSSHRRFGAKMTRPASASTVPGAPMPAALHLLQVQIAFIHRVPHAAGDALDHFLRRRARPWC